MLMECRPPVFLPSPSTISAFYGWLLRAILCSIFLFRPAETLRLPPEGLCTCHTSMTLRGIRSDNNAASRYCSAYNIDKDDHTHGTGRIVRGD
jgi:hypothetical protein